MFDTIHLEGDSYDRIGGTLWLVAFNLVLATFGIAHGAVAILNLIGSDEWPLFTTPGTEAYHPLWQLVVTWELLTVLILFPYALALMVCLSQRRRIFVRLSMGWFILGLIFAIVDLEIVSRIPAAVEQGALVTVTQQLVFLAFGAIFWTPYLRYSNRAKRTFVH
jgi:Protein of unknown function (DUF2569)